MIRDDFLLRQIRKLAELLAAQFRGGSDPREEEDLDRELTEAQSLTSLTPEFAVRVPLGSLLGVLGEPERVLRMGLLIAGRGGSPGRALELIEAAVAGDPDLDNPDLRAVREALAASL
ncbi:MAG: hypothetical protein EP330_20515 [Deltaproteobacteria bacterium]|nr:MAG: hypothetical protein EP330_20515 [Deltaproteobacteria bacterium]